MNADGKSTDPEKKLKAVKAKLQAKIAALEKSRAALLVSEQRHRIISELTTDYMCIIGIDENGRPRMEWASEGMKKMTGRGVSDAATLDQWRDTIHPEDRPRFMDFARRIITTGEAGDIECRSFSKDGRERWIQCLAKPQRD